MNYVVFSDGVGLVVSKEEWKWWQGLKTTMPDEDVADMHSFQKATYEYLKMFV